jgi:hypothetical protein
VLAQAREASQVTHIPTAELTALDEISSHIMDEEQTPFLVTGMVPSTEKIIKSEVLFKTQSAFQCVPRTM